MSKSRKKLVRIVIQVMAIILAISLILPYTISLFY